MRVFLVRHGAAEERGRRADDGARELTPQGAREVSRVARRLGKLGVEFGRLLTSPYARARQTAELLVSTGLAPAAEAHEALEPPGDFEAIVALIREWRGSEGTAIALVGHEPTLSAWAEALVWGRTIGRVELKKSGIVAVETPPSGPLPGHCTLVWLTSPKMLL